MQKLILSLALFSIILTPILSRAETPEEKGYQIAKRSDESDRGFGDSVARFKMILENAQGQTTEREVKNLILEMPDTSVGDKSIIVFYSPADVDGTALLSHAKILDPDDQWLFLPALKRVKRISSVNKSGPFVGSEFAFEDITARELGKYDYKYLRSEACGSLTCDVIEQYPKYENSGYTRLISWIDQTDFQARKMEFYDRKNAHLKTMTLGKYKKYNDQFWRAHQWEMVNHVTGKKTRLEYGDHQFQTGLDDKDFVKSVLKRVR